MLRPLPGWRVEEWLLDCNSPCDAPLRAVRLVPPRPHRPVPSRDSIIAALVAYQLEHRAARNAACRAVARLIGAPVKLVRQAYAELPSLARGDGASKNQPR